MAALVAGALLLVGRVQAFALDVAESCLDEGQVWDRSYYADHPPRGFPPSNPCNAEYDLVPAWVNSGMALAAVTAVGCATVGVAEHVRSRRRPPPGRPGRWGR